MNLHTASMWLGWAAVILGTLATYGQFMRLRRHGGEGVSLATWSLFGMLAIFWAIYGLAVRSWPLVVGSTLALPLEVGILTHLRAWRHRHVVATTAVLSLLCCVVPGLGWGWNGAVLGAGAAGTMTRAPQLVALVRSTHASGVSPGSWTLSVLVSSLWVLYYWGSHLWLPLTVTALGAGVSLSVAVLSRRRHLQERHQSVALS